MQKKQWHGKTVLLLHLNDYSAQKMHLDALNRSYLMDVDGLNYLKVPISVGNDLSVPTTMAWQDSAYPVHHLSHTCHNACI